MNDCIFCKIIKGEIPCTKVFEDENNLAFLDINPVSPGHTLIIPKIHSDWMQDASSDVIAQTFILAKNLMTKIVKNLGVDYVQLSVVGKDVPHFHVHLIPRMLGDNIHDKSIYKYAVDEMGNVAGKIKQ